MHSLRYRCLCNRNVAAAQPTPVRSNLEPAPQRQAGAVVQQFRDSANAATILFVKPAPVQTDRSPSLSLRGVRAN